MQFQSAKLTIMYVYTQKSPNVHFVKLTSDFKIPVEILFHERDVIETYRTIVGVTNCPMDSLTNYISQHLN